MARMAQPRDGRPAGGTTRPVEPRDRHPWHQLWAGYNAFYERYVPTEATEETWRRLNDPSEPVHGLVFERDGRVIGLAHHLYHPSTSSVAQSCYLQDLFVAEDARGTGAGRALLEATARAAALAGSHHVYWLTHESNARARALYDAVGRRTGFVHYAISAGARGKG